MSKLHSVVSGLLSRRSYGVYARGVNGEAVSAAGGDVATAKTDVASADVSSRATKKQDNKFWMRDPETGCWAPENRFQEVDDAVDLRNRLIRHK